MSFILFKCVGPKRTSQPPGLLSLGQSGDMSEMTGVSLHNLIKILLCKWCPTLFVMCRASDTLITTCRAQIKWLMKFDMSLLDPWINVAVPCTGYRRLLFVFVYHMQYEVYVPHALLALCTSTSTFHNTSLKPSSNIASTSHLMKAGKVYCLLLLLFFFYRRSIMCRAIAEHSIFLRTYGGMWTCASVPFDKLFIPSPVMPIIYSVFLELCEALFLSLCLSYSLYNSVSRPLYNPKYFRLTLKRNQIHTVEVRM